MWKITDVEGFDNCLAETKMIPKIRNQLIETLTCKKCCFIDSFLLQLLGYLAAYYDKLIDCQLKYNDKHMGYHTQ